MKQEIRILIADDHPIFRSGLRMAIEADPRLKVVAETGDGQSTLAQLDALRPDVAVLDFDMPAPDGLSVARRVREKGWPVKLVFLTLHKDEVLFNAALDAGVFGFVVKDSLANEIVGCIKAVAAGQRFFSPIVSGLLHAQRTRAGELTKRLPSLNDLTPSERRILKLIAESKTNKDIAEELFISIRTVETHRSNICYKLGLTGKHPLLTFALNHKAEL